MAIRTGAIRFVLLIAAVSWMSIRDARGQFGGGSNRIFGAVGGVAIDAAGTVRHIRAQDQAELLRKLRADIQGAEAGLAAPVPWRQISLKRLDAAIQAFIAKHPGKRLPESIRYMGGLQRIAWIVVAPEAHDIILIGPAEGWQRDATGVVRGIHSGRPVLHLEDWIVALRSAEQMAAEGLTCSIDPTADGVARLNRLYATYRQHRGRIAPSVLARQVKEAYGPQTVRVTGVPATTRLANLLVAADYRMKRLAMALDPAPMPGLPSYFGLLRRAGRAATGSHPRWWLAPQFGPIEADREGLTWSMPEARVRLQTENEYYDRAGQLRQTGKQDPLAKRFADAVTQRYDELAKADPLFAELRNVMELSVAASVVRRHHLLDKAGLELPAMLGTNRTLDVTHWAAPKTVAPECSIARVQRGWLVIASGGVSVEPWTIAANVVRKDAFADRPAKTVYEGSAWWSN